MEPRSGCSLDASGEGRMRQGEKAVAEIYPFFSRDAEYNRKKLIREAAGAGVIISLERAILCCPDGVRLRKEREMGLIGLLFASPLAFVLLSVLLLLFYNRP